jgi:hypothetical protein
MSIVRRVVLLAGAAFTFSAMAAVPAASASTPVVDHFFFDGAKVATTSTGFTESWVVYGGTSVNHSALTVGNASVKCRTLTDSTARCRADLDLGANKSDIEGAKFGEQTIAVNVSPVVLTGDQLFGDWSTFTSIVLKFRPVTTTGANVEVTLSS